MVSIIKYLLLVIFILTTLKVCAQDQFSYTSLRNGKYSFQNYENEKYLSVLIKKNKVVEAFYLNSKMKERVVIVPQNFESMDSLLRKLVDLNNNYRKFAEKYGLILYIKRPDSILNSEDFRLISEEERTQKFYESRSFLNSTSNNIRFERKIPVLRFYIYEKE